MKIKICVECEKDFTPTGNNQKYCTLNCQDAVTSRKSAGYTQAYRIRHNLIEKPGVGKGGNTQKGQSDSSYKTGIAYFMNNRQRIKEERRYCEECKKDLIDATRYHWVIHHKDHDRANNVDSNFQLLCKRCHQLEHDCVSAFTKKCND